MCIYIYIYISDRALRAAAERLAGDAVLDGPRDRLSRG